MLQAINDNSSWEISADGGVLAECPAIPVVDTGTACPTARSAPNMWDTSHKIYTVYKLPEDTGAFAHGCVDAEFPHFPYDHYQTFSALCAATLCALTLVAMLDKSMHCECDTCTSCGRLQPAVLDGDQSATPPLVQHSHSYVSCMQVSKFYDWLASWNWDLSVLADPAGERPQDTCLARYNANVAANGGAPLIDACACDAIVTDCHVNAVTAGSGIPENSAPFNVYNSAGLYDPPADSAQRAEWWNAASSDFAWRHECVHLLLSWPLRWLGCRLVAHAPPTPLLRATCTLAPGHFVPAVFLHCLQFCNTNGLTSLCMSISKLKK